MFVYEKYLPYVKEDKQQINKTSKPIIVFKTYKNVKV